VPATPVSYPLSLHDALPIFRVGDIAEWGVEPDVELLSFVARKRHVDTPVQIARNGAVAKTLFQPASRLLNDVVPPFASVALHIRSEEHTSELQSRSDLVCRL